MIHLQDVSKTYRTTNGPVHALAGVSDPEEKRRRIGRGNAAYD